MACIGLLIMIPPCCGFRAKGLFLNEASTLDPSISHGEMTWAARHTRTCQTLPVRHPLHKDRSLTNTTEEQQQHKRRCHFPPNICTARGVRVTYSVRKNPTPLTARINHVTNQRAPKPCKYPKQEISMVEQPTATAVNLAQNHFVLRAYRKLRGRRCLWS